MAPQGIQGRKKGKMDLFKGQRGEQARSQMTEEVSLYWAKRCKQDLSNINLTMGKISPIGVGGERVNKSMTNM